MQCFPTDFAISWQEQDKKSTFSTAINLVRIRGIRRKRPLVFQWSFFLMLQQDSRSLLYLLFDHSQPFGRKIVAGVLLKMECQQMAQLFAQFRRQNALRRAEKIIVHAGVQCFDIFLQSGTVSPCVCTGKVEQGIAAGAARGKGGYSLSQKRASPFKSPERKVYIASE